MARPMSAARRRVVIVGAGLGGLSAACHLVGRGYDVMVLERADEPGGRAGRLVRDGFTFDTGPTVLTMPDLLEATVQAAGAELADLLTLRRLDPAYRACFADGSHHPGSGRSARRWPRRSGPPAGRPRLRRSSGSAAGSTGSMRWRCPRSSTATTTTSADLVRPLGPALRLLRLGGFAQPARRGGVVLLRRAAAPAVQLPGAVRRAVAAPGPGRLRRHHLHGHRRRRLVRRRRDARRAARPWPRRPRRPARSFRFGTEVERDPACGRTRGAVRGVRPWTAR